VDPYFIHKQFVQRTTDTQSLRQYRDHVHIAV
jgi:hypothetical protein